jgi:hypothetical protein
MISLADFMALPSIAEQAARFHEVHRRDKKKIPDDVVNAIFAYRVRADDLPPVDRDGLPIVPEPPRYGAPTGKARHPSTLELPPEVNEYFGDSCRLDDAYDEPPPNLGNGGDPASHDHPITVRGKPERVTDAPQNRGARARIEKHFDVVPMAKITLPLTSNQLVRGILPRRGLVIIWGRPKCGKSFWTYDLLMHVALGWEYRGHRVKQGAVVYCAPEGAYGFPARIEAFRQKFLPESADDVQFYLVPCKLALAKDHVALIRDIRAAVPPEIKIVAVAIDTLNRSIEGSESKDEDMGAYLNAAYVIEETFACVVPIVHHCGHDDSRPRGHSSITGTTDAQIAVTRDEVDNVIAEVEWMKDGPSGARITSRLETVEVGKDEDGEPITSCVIVETEDGLAVEKTGSKNLTAHEKLRRAFVRTYERLADGVAKSPGLDAKATPVLKVSVDAIRDDLKKRGAFELKDGAITAAHKTLFWKVKTDLTITTQTFTEVDGLIWRIKAEAERR